MPYKRKYQGTSRKRIGAARVKRQKRYNGSVYARLPQRTLRQTNRVTGVTPSTADDVHVLDHTINLTIDNSSDLLLLNGLFKGTGIHNRDGNTISMLSLQMNVGIEPQATAPSQTIRYTLFYDKFPNQSAPNYQNVFQTRYITGVAPGTVNTSYTIYSPRNQFYKDRFIILRDSTYTLEGTDDKEVGKDNTMRKANSDAAPVIRSFMPLKGLATNFDSDGDAGTIADIVQGALYLMVTSDQALSGTNNCDIFGTARLRFKK